MPDTKELLARLDMSREFEYGDALNNLVLRCVSIGHSCLGCSTVPSFSPTACPCFKTSHPSEVSMPTGENGNYRGQRACVLLGKETSRCAAGCVSMPPQGSETLDQQIIELLPIELTINRCV